MDSVHSLSEKSKRLDVETRRHLARCEDPLCDWEVCQRLRKAHMAGRRFIQMFQFRLLPKVGNRQREEAIRADERRRVLANAFGTGGERRVGLRKELR